ncbi:MAG: PilN domain-containing protein [Rhodocyclaceae bacterium]|jgi:Tfp pilus assembly protein PilN|nr:PilN domain-containing protein [Rhodocyclaceae bacterium]
MKKFAVPPALALDFSGRRRPPGILGWLLLALGLLATGWELADWRAGQTDLAEREAIVARLRHQAQRTQPVAEPASERPVAEQDARPALRVAGQLGADWGGLWRDLAVAEDPGMALLSLEVDGPRGELRISGQARSLAAVFDYLARLEATPGVAAARLVNYEAVTVGAAELFRFNATARWVGQP